MKLYHCLNARSLRPLWALEEMGLAYELITMAFPPRFEPSAGRRGLVRANCLDRSLFLHWLLSRRGIPGELLIGVDRTDDGLRAHAWVECAGEILGDPAEVAHVFGALE